MTNHEITKPKLFISHATSDGEFANAVKQEIEKVFANDRGRTGIPIRILSITLTHACANE